ncbi:hypothetical protein TKK_0018896 [Trichogramma kaykai]
MILTGLWYRTNKPHPNLFMSSFTQELRTLFREVNFEISNFIDPIRVRALIISGTCDLPAIDLFRNTKQYNALYGCTNCYILTERVGFVQKYPYVDEFLLVKHVKLTPTFLA